MPAIAVVAGLRRRRRRRRGRHQSAECCFKFKPLLLNIYYNVRTAPNRSPPATSTTLHVVSSIGCVAECNIFHVHRNNVYTLIEWQCKLPPPYTHLRHCICNPIHSRPPHYARTHAIQSGIRIIHCINSTHKHTLNHHANTSNIGCPSSVCDCVTGSGVVVCLSGCCAAQSHLPIPNAIHASGVLISLDQRRSTLLQTVNRKLPRTTPSRFANTQFQTRGSFLRCACRRRRSNYQLECNPIGNMRNRRGRRHNINCVLECWLARNKRFNSFRALCAPKTNILHSTTTLCERGFMRFGKSIAYICMRFANCGFAFRWNA